MRVIVSGGGTAGHINPALSLAEELQARGHEVRYAGTPEGLERRLAAQANLDYEAFRARGFDRARPASLLRAVGLALGETRRARRWLSQVRADAVVTFGGYVCLPVGRAALAERIPLVVHEQNSVMGLANRYLAQRAQAVCLTYAAAGQGLSARGPVAVTGNPVRASVLSGSRAQGREMLGIPDDALILLVTGGSLGARHVNDAVCGLKGRLLSHEGLHVVHVTGPNELDRVRETLALTDDEARRWHLFGYQDHMGACMAAADAVVSRAGATSLAEISARALPALLVPFPHATADHQTANARSYVDAGCAFMVPDAEVEGERFAEWLFTLIESDEVRRQQAACARAQQTSGAAGRLADAVERAAASSSRS
ncbi:UDP-N-acetylglucosamine--N-acetylmuramyl-(pentapeptide) pyrophosphoryl-undecaprenol N-acetylglucosamine transferase [Eggerthellaceae bacterium zg-1084]|uniref:UDP-N-acetylglucosamine--N-acetylmuramyl- (pentapeptide) pyrophosphoryl-undecaprenol N-acetylglucosamine transferase n=1 Tax=Berryella wangjianweii TaxID=2734634 RepID=UPI00155817FE|nr:UDP-N-acetylglucosamine--N-acetylmuramyl-(pentapeptide) pyrophosphoryl-undecaprenol N-acetylglucosamine transferase [Berryella wangjianweii]NPD31447.1 UDP-N-acetylglucosamine--N-acetylmuramyl-(pentapeptide) pyrophosphoryl-undecaprenol N-acetylglucosamine transferase [Berryella wangjianweii]